MFKLAYKDNIRTFHSVFCPYLSLHYGNESIPSHTVHVISQRTQSWLCEGTLSAPTCLVWPWQRDGLTGHSPVTLDGDDYRGRSSTVTPSLVTRPEEKWEKLATGTPCRNTYTKTGTERHLKAIFLNIIWSFLKVLPKKRFVLMYLKLYCLFNLWFLLPFRAKVKTVTFLLPVDDIYTSRPVLTKHQDEPKITELAPITETDSWDFERLWM